MSSSRLRRFVLTGTAVLWLVARAGSARAQLAGTYSVGPTGTFPSLTAAVAAATAQGLGGAVVFELQPGYTSGAETFPVTIGAIPGSSGANTLTLRPQAGATGLTLGNVSGTLLSFAAASHVVVDGRPGGVGPSRELTLDCGSTSNAVTFTDGARHDTLRSLVIRGRTTSTSGGVLYFGSSPTTIGGNSDNLVEDCYVGAGATTPSNLIYSAGTTLTAEWFNTRNTIRDCELADWFSASVSSYAILLAAGNRSWTIQRNSLYQTAARTITLNGPSFGGISVGNSIDTLVVDDNWIGGSAPHCAGSPLALSTVGGALMISMASGGTPRGSASGNVVRNLALATGVGSGPRLMSLNGNLSVFGNLLGDTVSTGSITVSFTSGSFIAMAVGSNDSCRIEDNRIGGISVTSSVGSVTGLQLSPAAAAAIAVRNNLVGSESVEGSFTSSGSGAFSGIYFATSGTPVSPIEGNVVAHLVHTAPSSANAMYGIRVSAGHHTILDNRVHDLSSSVVSTGGIGAVSLVGVQFGATSNLNYVIAGNTVHSLSHSAPTSAAHVIGLNMNFPAGNYTIERNRFHSFSVASTDTGAMVTGIYAYSGAATPAATFSNNMIRLGIDAQGSHATVAAKVRGIFCQGAHTYVGNSVYVGGAPGGAPSSQTWAFYVWAAGTAPTLRNNILVNERGVLGGGRHFAIYINQQAGGVTSTDFNLLHAPGPSGRVGGYGPTTYASLAAWQGTGRDLNSVTGDPKFVNATGNAGAVDLHVDASAMPASAAADAGTPYTGWYVDFDGTLRDATSPDIGADEFVLGVTAVDGTPAPGHTLLAPVRPNPVRGACAIEFALAADGRAVVELFDVRGRRVRRLASDVRAAGTHRVQWDGRDDAARALPPGSYFVRLSVGATTEVRRLVLLD